MLATEAALTVMAITILVLGVVGLLVGSVSVTHAWRRLSRNPEAGARREWACQQFHVVGSLFSMVVLFMGAGLAIALMPDTELRAAVARACLMLAFFVLMALLFVYPVSQSRIEALATREAEDRSAHESPRRADRPPGWSGRSRQLEKKGER